MPSGKTWEVGGEGIGMRATSAVSSVGVSVGKLVVTGRSVGFKVGGFGATVGIFVELKVGTGVDLKTGAAVGVKVGDPVRRSVGVGVGLGVGKSVGFLVGNGEG